LNPKSIRFLSRVFIATIVLSMVMSALSMSAVYASDTRTFSISAMDMDVTIKDDGSLVVVERITYNFQGVFNGIFRDIDISDTDGLTDLEVGIDRNGDFQPFTNNRVNSLDSSGEPGTYHQVQSGNLEKLKIFEKSQDEQKTFIIRYKLLNVINVYQDTAALNRKLIDANWTENLSNISILLTLPVGAQKDELRIFVHGPLEGTSELVDGSHVKITSPFSMSGSVIETLLLFPKTLVPNAARIENRDALPSFLENEKILANEANAQREAAKEQVALEQAAEKEREARMLAERARQEQLKKIGGTISVIMVILWLGIVIYLYIKYDKERRSSFYGKYYRELPGDYTPGEMSVLMNGTAGTNDVMATLMDLVRKKQLILASQDEYKKGLFGGKTVTTHAFVYRADAPPFPLKQHEIFLMNWFINGIGDGSSVTLDEIKDYGKVRSNALEFKSKYDKWIAMVKKEAGTLGFDDLTIKKPITVAVLIGMAWFGIGLFVSIKLNTSATIIPTILGLALTIYAATIKRRTSYGNDQYVMWKAFRRFLKDFSNLEQATIPSVIIWEHYLVYAIALGVADDVIKQLPIILRNEDLNNPNLTYLYGAHYASLALFSNTLNDTMKSVQSAISTASSVANSASSSTSGGGGGFSGGSSGGGGGGGGGGAF